MAEIALPRPISLDAVLRGILQGGRDGTRRVATGDGQTFYVPRPSSRDSRRVEPRGTGTDGRLSPDEVILGAARRVWEADKPSLEKRDAYVIRLIKAIDASLEELGLKQLTVIDPGHLDTLYRGHELHEARSGVAAKGEIFQGPKLAKSRRQKGR